MKIRVDGGDERFVRLARRLCEYGDRNGTAHVLGDAQNLEQRTAGIPDEDLVMVFSPQKAEGKRRVIHLLEEESFLRENACLTAEGAVVCAAQKMKCALRGSVCLIVGFGRIGQALTDLLVGMGACPVVYARREEARMRAMQRGALATADLREGLKGAKVIFSTPPEMILDEKTLIFAEKDAVILDLASAPFGVDLEAAGKLGLNAWREGGIPGRYCPESAAEALENIVKKIIDREGSNSI